MWCFRVERAHLLFTRTCFKNTFSTWGLIRCPQWTSDVSGLSVVFELIVLHGKEPSLSPLLRGLKRKLRSFFMVRLQIG